MIHLPLLLRQPPAKMSETTVITDYALRVTAQQRFLPYGGVRWQEGTFPTDVGFTGHRGHAALGLVYMRARYYHPALGRFVSADTIVPEPGNPQDLNRYMYAGNNPLRFVDPDGHAKKDPIKKGGTKEPPPKNTQILPRFTSLLLGSSLPMPTSPQSERSPLLPDAIGWRFEGSGSLSAIGGDTLIEAASATGSIPLIALTAAATHIGVDVNIDIVLNLNSQETGEWIGIGPALMNIDENLDIFFSVNGQCLTRGAGVSTGPIAIWNLPKNDDLSGWGFQIGGTVKQPVGVLDELEVFAQPTNAKYPIVGGYLALVGVGSEMSLGIGGGYTVNITDFVFNKVLRVE